MEDDIKPDVTDSAAEESSVAEAISDLFEEGETNEAVTAEEKPAITLERFEQLAGRKFDSIEDAEKHYENLKSFVGKKTGQEAPKKDSAPVVDIDAKIAEAVKNSLEERELANNPASKEYLDLAKAVAKDKGISLGEAWEKHVKALATDAAEHRKGRDVGVNSKTRINPTVSKQNQETIDQARLGKPEAVDNLVGSFLKGQGMMK